MSVPWRDIYAGLREGITAKLSGQDCHSAGREELRMVYSQAVCDGLNSSCIPPRPDCQRLKVRIIPRRFNPARFEYLTPPGPVDGG